MDPTVILIVLGLIALAVGYLIVTHKINVGKLQEKVDALLHHDKAATPADPYIAPAAPTAPQTGVVVNRAEAPTPVPQVRAPQSSGAVGASSLRQTYANLGEFIQELASSTYTQAVTLRMPDGVLQEVHGGAGPALPYVMQADGSIRTDVDLAAMAKPTPATGTATHSVGGADGSNAPAGYARTSPGGYPLFYPIGADGKPAGAPAVVFDGQSFANDAAVEDYKKRTAGLAEAYAARDANAASEQYDGAFPVAGLSLQDKFYLYRMEQPYKEKTGRDIWRDAVYGARSAAAAAHNDASSTHLPEAMQFDADSYSGGLVTWVKNRMNGA